MVWEFIQDFLMNDSYFGNGRMKCLNASPSSSLSTPFPTLSPKGLNLTQNFFAFKKLLVAERGAPFQYLIVENYHNMQNIKFSFTFDITVLFAEKDYEYQSKKNNSSIICGTVLLMQSLQYHL